VLAFIHNDCQEMEPGPQANALGLRVKAYNWIGTNKPASLSQLPICGYPDTGRNPQFT